MITQSPAQDLLKGQGKTVDPHFSRAKFGVVGCPHAVRWTASQPPSGCRIHDGKCHEQQS
ncbi:hypothetical protein [Pseudomonas lactucae]|uniref:Uncharacterized protein n=1 Tax=Pseudomonas lactucae TaxID=2813360 RepID=A0A9X1C6W2_9PSED|nr:hypothetical protein [Pseudomonas lactucae]MBN2978561.1 hypothetical protein [Pseudomonas lactucae]MBN2985326.1 hypothetical protein [Pseudomonas lactucae]